MQLRRTVIGALALLCMLAMPGVTASPGITAVGTLDRFSPEALAAFGPSVLPNNEFDFYKQAVAGTLLPVPGAGQVWQLYPLDPARTRTGVLVKEAASRRVIGSFVLEAELRRGSLDAAGGSEWLHTTDGGRRVFVVTVGAELLEIDATTFAVRSRGRLQPVVATPLNGPVVVGGLSFDSTTGDVLVLYGGPAPLSLANRLTVLETLDPETGARRTRLVRSCAGAVPATDAGSTYAAELLVRGDAVYVTCQFVLKGWLGSPLPDEARALVVRLPRASLWDLDGDEASLDAGPRFQAALVDPDSGRIAVVDHFGHVRVVDTASMAVVAGFDVTASPASSTVGLGLDRTSGRFFFQSNLGFGFAELRATPVPPVTVDATAAGSGKERIHPVGNRVYVLRGDFVLLHEAAEEHTIYNIAS